MPRRPFKFLVVFGDLTSASWSQVRLAEECASKFARERGGATVYGSSALGRGMLSQLTSYTPDGRLFANGPSKT